jgi:hypothetical protein
MVENNIQSSLDRLRTSSSPLIHLQPPADQPTVQRKVSSADQPRHNEDFVINLVGPTGSLKEVPVSSNTSPELKFLLYEPQQPEKDLLVPQQHGVSQSNYVYPATGLLQHSLPPKQTGSTSPYLQFPEESLQDQNPSGQLPDSFAFTDVFNLNPGDQSPTIGNSKTHIPVNLMLDSLMTSELKPELRMASLLAKADVEDQPSLTLTSPGPSLDALYNFLDQQLTQQRDIGLIRPHLSVANSLSHRADPPDQPPELGLLTGDEAALAAYRELHQQALAATAAEAAHYQSGHSSFGKASFNPLPELQHPSQTYPLSNTGTIQKNFEIGKPTGGQSSNIQFINANMMNPFGTSLDGVAAASPHHEAWHERRGKTTLHEDTSFQPSVPDTGPRRLTEMLPFLNSQQPELIPFFPSSHLSSSSVKEQSNIGLSPYNSYDSSQGIQNNHHMYSSSDNHNGPKGSLGGQQLPSQPTSSSLVGGGSMRQVEPMQPLVKADLPLVGGGMTSSNNTEVIRPNSSMVQPPLRGSTSGEMVFV